MAEGISAGTTVFVEYSADISEIPESIAVIPFLCNTLPISWVWNAEIQVPSCDWDFYHCIEAVKQGYKDMYPSVRFAGTFTAYNIIKNENPRNKGTQPHSSAEEWMLFIHWWSIWKRNRFC